MRKKSQNKIKTNKQTKNTKKKNTNKKKIQKRGKKQTNIPTEANKNGY